MLKKLICKTLRDSRVMNEIMDRGNMIPLNYGITMRIAYFYELLKLVKNVKGSIVECGVGKGFGLCIWSALLSLENENRIIWAFDSFEGFPKLTKEDGISETLEKSLGEYKKFDMPYVYRTLSDFELSRVDIDRRIVFVKGFIPDSLAKYDGKPIALLNLDLDIYRSYKSAIEGLWDKVASGGVVCFDEYDRPTDQMKYPGAARAINEFLDSRGLRAGLVKNTATGNSYLIKK